MIRETKINLQREQWVRANRKKSGRGAGVTSGRKVVHALGKISGN